jgi:branched-chain amino acid aminotransferase
VVTRNGYRCCYVRPMLWRGLGTLGINPLPNPVDALVAAWHWAASTSDERATTGWRLVTSGWTRPPAAAMPGKAKAAGNYVNSMLARMDALSAGFDNALLLDTQGFVSEGTAENVFFVRDGALHALDHGVALAGITRDTVLTLARDEGIDLVLCRATREELWSADEVFLTGTAAEVVPVTEIDHRRVGTGAVGPVTAHLRTRYLDVCQGRDARYESWLHRP